MIAACASVNSDSACATRSTDAAGASGTAAVDSTALGSLGGAGLGAFQRRLRVGELLLGGDEGLLRVGSGRGAVERGTARIGEVCAGGRDIADGRRRVVEDVAVSIKSQNVRLAGIAEGCRSVGEVHLGLRNGLLLRTHLGLGAIDCAHTLRTPGQRDPHHRDPRHQYHPTPPRPPRVDHHEWPRSFIAGSQNPTAVAHSVRHRRSRKTLSARRGTAHHPSRMISCTHRRPARSQRPC